MQIHDHQRLTKTFFLNLVAKDSLSLKEKKKWNQRRSKFSVLELTDIVVLWAYYTIHFGFSIFWHFCQFGTSLSNIFDYFVWLRITDEGSLPEMPIWSILLIEFDLKWCTHLSKVFFYIGTDGTSVMTGRKNGVVARLNEHSPCLVHLVHCLHSLCRSQMYSGCIPGRQVHKTTSRIL